VSTSFELFFLFPKISRRIMPHSPRNSISTPIDLSASDEERNADDVTKDPSYGGDRTTSGASKSKSRQKKAGREPGLNPGLATKPAQRKGRPPRSTKKSSTPALSVGTAANTPKTVEEELSEWRLKHSRLVTKVKKLSQDLSDANESNLALQKTADRLQFEHVQLISKNKIEVSTDDDLDAEYSAIFEQTKTFAKEWTQNMLSGTARKHFVDAVSSITAESNQPLATDRFLDEVESGDVKPMLIANTLINAILCRLIFEKPFAHFEFESTGLEGRTIDAALEWTINRASQSE
jgi:hypothetical protein